MSEEVKAEMAIQVIGVNKLMSADPDYRSEDAYEVLCKVASYSAASFLVEWLKSSSWLTINSFFNSKR